VYANVSLDRPIGSRRGLRPPGQIHPQASVRPQWLADVFFARTQVISLLCRKKKHNCLTNSYKKVIFFIINLKSLKTPTSGVQKGREKEVDRLYTIEPVGEGRPAAAVAREVLALFRGDFKYNILDLTGLLCCQRDWVEDNILPEVLHIHLNRFFRDYVIGQAVDLSEAEFTTLRRGHYFFSEKDLARYWAENAKSDKKVRIIDLADYLSPHSSLRDLELERQRHQVFLRQRQEKALHRDHMSRLLTEEGFALFLSGSQGRFEWVGVKTPSWRSVRGRLVSEALYRRQNGYTTSSAAHTKLAVSGAVRIKLGSRTLWVPNDQPSKREQFWPFPVQA